MKMCCLVIKREIIRKLYIDKQKIGHDASNILFRLKCIWRDQIEMEIYWPLSWQSVSNKYMNRDIRGKELCQWALSSNGLEQQIGHEARNILFRLKCILRDQIEMEIYWALSWQSVSNKYMNRDIRIKELCQWAVLD
jgi:hypothetical protein